MLAAYESALAFPPILKDIEALVQAILSRASYEKRRMDTDEGGMLCRDMSSLRPLYSPFNSGEEVLTTLVEVLIEGIAKVRQGEAPLLKLKTVELTS